MHSLWVSLKESLSCKSCKLIAVVVRPERTFIATTTTHDYYNSTYDDEDDTASLKVEVEEESKNKNKNILMAPPTLMEPNNHFTTLLYELNIGDQSRNVVEIIFLAALVKPSKQRRINQVFKVINQIEVLNRFEEYRAMVKTNALQHKKHPRNSVDGNELLRFYGTTMACFNRKNNSSFSQCCLHPSCGVCRLISYSFDSEHTNNGIHLTTNSDTMSDNLKGSLKGKKGRTVKRAVVLCRIIAGEVAFGLCSSLETLILRNPRAVLPCFVIVFT